VHEALTRFPVAKQPPEVSQKGQLTMQNNAKVAIIGAGIVGANAAFLVSMQGVASEIVLLDLPGQGAEGKALDINQAGYWAGYDPVVVGTDTYDEVAGAKVVVITAGFPRRPDISRDQLLAKNKVIVREVATNVRAVAPEALVVVVTNPVEPLCHAVTSAGFRPDKVIGMAPLVDAARFAWYVAEGSPSTRPRDVDAYVVGRHSDTHMVPLASHSFVHGEPVGRLRPPERVARAVERTRRGGKTILEMLPTGSTAFLPAVSVAKTVTELLVGERTEMRCVAYHRHENGVEGLYMGCVAVVDRSGVCSIRDLRLVGPDADALREAANDLAAVLDAMTDE
jgi:malate dehydrogenase